jgi:putative spermidine/putrescine transport system permease protein
MSEMLLKIVTLQLEPHAQRRIRLSLLVAPLLVVMTGFLVMPLVGLFRASFYTGDGFISRSGFSFDHYLHLLFDGFYLSVLLETLAYGVVVAVVGGLIGFPVGYSLARLSPAARRWRMIIVILPLTLSLVVVVFGWLSVLGRTGFINSLMVGIGLFDTPQTLLFTRTAVIVVLVQQTIPFMILSIMSVVAQIDPDLEQAAANLRANRFTTFRRVIVPLALPGVVAGFVLVFVISISAFITPMLIGGNRVQMMGSFIFEQMMSSMNWSFGAAMSFVVFAAGLLFTGLLNSLVGPHRFQK